MNATTTKSFFSRETRVSIIINAPLSVIWKHLTDASNYTSWNSTVVSIEGEIVAGEKIALTSTLDPKRTFKLTVKEMVENQRLVWGDFQGQRVFELVEQDGGVLFSMHEKIGGPLFPLFAKMIPSFDESFNHIAADLKSVSET